ncbi:DUF4282 domain-containing protein [uncultured Limimaricola sp.]|uniref:DUF4282 domain-containing protein n=1 Tax=uncultured Limimaricola sp. TaxID=2211667 RepID=UPI0030FBD0CF
MIKSFFQFDVFIFPKVVRIVFAIGAIGIILATVIGMITQLFAGWAPISARFGTAIFTLVGGLASLLGWRISIELMLVLFSINDRLKRS